MKPALVTVIQKSHYVQEETKDKTVSFDYKGIASIKPELQDKGSFFTIVIVLRDLNLFNLITLLNITFLYFLIQA